MLSVTTTKNALVVIMRSVVQTAAIFSDHRALITCFGLAPAPALHWHAAAHAKNTGATKTLNIATVGADMPTVATTKNALLVITKNVVETAAILSDHGSFIS